MAEDGQGVRSGKLVFANVLRLTLVLKLNANRFFFNVKNYLFYGSRQDKRFFLPDASFQDARVDNECHHVDVCLAPALIEARVARGIFW